MALVLFASPIYADPPIYPLEDVTIGGVGENGLTETVQCLCKGTAQNDLYYIGDIAADNYYAATYDCVQFLASGYTAAVFQTGLFNSVASVYDYLADPSKLIVEQNNKYYCRIPVVVQRYKTKTGPAPVDCSTLNYTQAIPDVTVSYPAPLPELTGPISHTLTTPDVQMSCTRMVYP